MTGGHYKVEDLFFEDYRYKLNKRPTSRLRIPVLRSLDNSSIVFVSKPTKIKGKDLLAWECTKLKDL